MASESNQEPPEIHQGGEFAVEDVDQDEQQISPADAPTRPQTLSRKRTMTTTEEIESTIIHPGSVRINVKGAFIVDPGSNSPANPSNPATTTNTGRGSPTHPETSDIRLPNHTAVVSHIAIDVCSVTL
jgi:hypothetical protein